MLDEYAVESSEEYDEEDISDHYADDVSIDDRDSKSFEIKVENETKGDSN